MRKLLLFCFIISSLKLSAQNADTSAFNKPLLRLQLLGDSLLKGNSDSIRIASNFEFLRLADSIITNPLSNQLSFYQCNTLSVINSDDKKIRIYNWMLPAYDGNSYRYFGYVQIWDPKKKQVKTYHLNEQKNQDNEAIETQRLDTSNWYGCIYYKIIHQRKKRKDSYVLLGWSPNTLFTTRKIIEPITFSVNKIIFGAPVLRTGGRPKFRMVFEYNARVQMSLRFDESTNLLVFDHLSSSDPRPESRGMYQLYGPDLSFDAFKFDKGSWYFLRDVDIRNENNTNGKPSQLNKKLRITKRQHQN